MGERRMAQQMRLLERFRHPVTIDADASVIPCASQKETLSLTLAPFRDHGRPAFVGSTIRSRNPFIDAADELSESEAQRINAAMGRTMISLLDEGLIRSDMVLLAPGSTKPDVHVIVIGDSYKESSLMLYCHRGEYKGATVLYQDARVRKGNSQKVVREFIRAGYRPPVTYDKGKRD